MSDTEQTRVPVPVEVPTLRTQETFKVEASGYVALELLDRINGGDRERALPAIQYQELVRFTPGYDGSWNMPGDGSPVFTFATGKTYAVVEVIEDDDR